MKKKMMLMVPPKSISTSPENETISIRRGLYRDFIPVFVAAAATTFLL
jgi:hypothetical protein